METHSIVEFFNEGEQVALGVCPRRIFLMMDKLGFESVEEALHAGIVEAIAFTGSSMRACQRVAERHGIRLRHIERHDRNDGPDRRQGAGAAAPS